MELILALYGALLSTVVAVLGFLHWRSTRTEIRVKAFLVNAPEGEGGHGQIMAVLVNRSAHDVLVTHISVLSADKQRAILWPRPFPVGLRVPVEVKGRRYLMAWNPMDTELPEPYRIQAQTADDRRFRSRKFRMSSLPELDYFDPAAQQRRSRVPPGTAEP